MDPLGSQQHFYGPLDVVKIEYETTEFIFNWQNQALLNCRPYSALVWRMEESLCREIDNSETLPFSHDEWKMHAAAAAATSRYQKSHRTIWVQWRVQEYMSRHVVSVSFVIFFHLGRAEILLFAQSRKFVWTCSLMNTIFGSYAHNWTMKFDGAGGRSVGRSTDWTCGIAEIRLASKRIIFMVQFICDEISKTHVRT